MTVRRMKTYTGGQGYVYQYYFVGKRAARPEQGNDPATEYIFDVTSDRKATFAVSVFLPQQALGRWSAVHGRDLTDAEQYGAVKMCLFKAFDEMEDVRSSRREFILDPATLESVLGSLGIA